MNGNPTGGRTRAATASAVRAMDSGLFGHLTLRQLERRAYRLYAAEGPRGKAWQTAVDALCAARYSGDSHHDYRRHQRRWHLWQPDPLRVAQARAYVLRNGCRVRVLGAALAGTVVDVRFLNESTGPHPAPWYVVSYDHLQICRAHGSEELEPETPADDGG
ncbi:MULTISPECIES: hypothetical protein [Streptomyces]|uniref:hypothetical protein n=1 Tax=Streptomyces TaxID=1883 RepID=UPI002F91CA11